MDLQSSLGFQFALRCTSDRYLSSSRASHFLADRAQLAGSGPSVPRAACRCWERNPQPVKERFFARLLMRFRMVFGKLLLDFPNDVPLWRTAKAGLFRHSGPFFAVSRPLSRAVRHFVHLPALPPWSRCCFNCGTLFMGCRRTRSSTHHRFSHGIFSVIRRLITSC